MPPIYLDYNATTPIDPQVAEAMLPCMTTAFGNPSSTHWYGIQTKKVIEHARTQVAALLDCHADEILFTSGGSEANNLAIKGYCFAHRDRGSHLIISAVEHPAVVEVAAWLAAHGFTVTTLPVDTHGMVSPADLERAIRPETLMVSIMHANNEVGTIQPISELAAIATSRRIAFHCDAAQSAGKIAVRVGELGVDLLSIAGHKLYAPKGIGALFIRRGITLEKQIHGAGHERGLRAGTENVLEITGLGAACAIATRDLNSQMPRLAALRDRLYDALSAHLDGLRRNGHPKSCLPNTLSLSFHRLEANTILAQLPEVAASAGAACHSDSITISPVLEAMGVPIDWAMGTIRFSVGKMTTEAEIDAAAAAVLRVVAGLRGGSAAAFPLTPGPEPDNAQASHAAAPGSMTNLPDPTTSIPRPATSIPGPGGRQEPASPQPAGSVVTPPLGPAVTPAISPAVTTAISPAATTATADPNSLQPAPEANIELTRYTHGLGCACKLRPQSLEKILAGLPRPASADLLVGAETSDDAAVWRLDDRTAIISTVDFFTPIVDDPWHFGAIAAANALSDIYAMGGEPLFALNLVAFPVARLPLESLEQILHGAAAKAAEAGIDIVGGHSIDDTEPKYGLAVTGRVNPQKIWRNIGARPGDALLLTKPIGLGILSTAMKRGMLDRKGIDAAIAVMSELNRAAAAAAHIYTVHACTDITGFGLLGHLLEMSRGSQMDIVVNWQDVPLLEGAWEMAEQGAVPGGSRSNLDHVAPHVSFAAGIPETARLLLADAQTSGGLLLAVPASEAPALLTALQTVCSGPAAIIGSVTAPGPGIISVV